MKTIQLLFGAVVFSLFLAGCSTSNTTYAYDDLYYSPNNDPVKQVQKNPREDFNKTENIQYDGSYNNRYENDTKPSNYPESIYQNRYTQAEQSENQGQVNSETQFSSNANNEDIEYYDEDYANTLQQLNSPVRSFDTYNSYQRDRIVYTNDPFFATPSVYGRYSFWDPFVPATGLSVGWNSFNGWNIGVGAGFGCVAPLNPFVGFYDPFYRPFNNFYGGYGGFWDPFYGNRWNRWNNPYAWNNTPYWAGYNNGFNDGRFNNGNFNNDRSGGRRRITTARGNSGSNSVGSSGTTRPTRSTRNNRVNSNSPTGTNTNGRPVRPTRTVATGAGGSNEISPTKRPTRSETPNQYKTPRTPTYYSKPRETSRPTRVEGGNTTPRQTIRNNAPVQQNSRPQYTRPRQNNSYNNSNRVTPLQTQPNRQQTQPRQQQYSQPKQQSRPTNNYNRSRPSYNNSKPSYSAPSRSTPSRGSNSNSSRPTRPSRR